jgi:hypothetical protein
MKALVVTYSRSGNTKAVGRRIAEALGGTLAEIVDVEAQGHRGAFGAIRLGFQSLGKRPMQIVMPSETLEDYDVLAIGTPIWGGRIAEPVSRYLSAHSGRFPVVAFFYTCGGGQHSSALDEMAKLAAVEPVATLGLTRPERTSPQLAAHIERFVDEIRSKAGAEPDA